MEIGDGGTASSAFYEIFLNQVNDEELRQNLLKYCERDTWAMVVLMEQLEAVLKKINNVT